MRLTRNVFGKTAKLIDSYSNYNPSPLSLKKFTDFGMQTLKMKTENEEYSRSLEKQSYVFLKEELLVRLALMTREMLYLPDRLIHTPSVKAVHSWYLKSFEEIFEFKETKNSDDDLKKFNRALNSVVERHRDVVQNMAMGILQVEETYGIDNKTGQNIQYFLDRFLMSRISIRMLINQHLLMFCEKNKLDEKSTQIGSIDPNCEVVSVLQDAYDNAKFLCDQYYLASPDNDLISKNIIQPDQDIKLVYVPGHLYHIAFELYKNAMRAVIESHGSAARSYPKIQTLVIKGEEDLSIRITDLGGGIPQSKLSHVFKYMYSSAPRPAITSDIYDTQSNAPLAGYGYGLPLSRLYARYFNGDLQLSSIDGHSTDACIYLRTLSKDANESLPLYNRTTESKYKNNRDRNSDWT